MYTGYIIVMNNKSDNQQCGYNDDNTIYNLCMYACMYACISSVYHVCVLTSLYKVHL